MNNSATTAALTTERPATNFLIVAQPQTLVAPSASVPATVPDAEGERAAHVATVVRLQAKLDTATRYFGTPAYGVGTRRGVVIGVAGALVGALGGVVAGMLAAAIIPPGAVERGGNIFATSVFGSLGVAATVWAGGAICHSIVTAWTKQRRLPPEQLQGLESAFAEASPAGQAILAALARSWLAKLDRRDIIGGEARTRLHRLAEAKLPEEATQSAKRIVEVLNRAYRSDCGTVETWLTSYDVEPLVGWIKTLTADEHRAVCPAMLGLLFKGGDAPRFRYSKFSDVSAVYHALTTAPADPAATLSHKSSASAPVS